MMQEEKGYRGSPLLVRLLRQGELTPGERVLHVTVRGSDTPIYLGLDDDGFIWYDGLQYPNVSAAVFHAATLLRLETIPKLVRFHQVRYIDGRTIKEIEKSVCVTSEVMEPETPTEDDTGCHVPSAWISMDSDLPSWSAFSRPRGHTMLQNIQIKNNSDWKVDMCMDAMEEDDTVAMEEEATVQMCDLDGGSMDPDGVLDMHVEKSEVISRIESVCEFVLECIMDKTSPNIPCRMDGAVGKKSFSLDSEKSLIRFSRMSLVLDKVHEILSDAHGKRITQRDLYYVAKAKDRNIKAPQMMELIQDTSQVLHVPRFAMGLDCRSKGLVYGPLVVGGNGKDCSEEARGCPISGSTMEVLHATLACSASCIIVIEKETLFQRLIPESQRDSTLRSCLLVTGCGYPDLATRVLLHKLGKAYPDIPMVGIFDWNPHGVQIMCQYRYGSKKSIESQSFKIGSLHWLGVRSPMIRSVLSSNDCLEDLSLRDRGLIKSLKASLEESGNKAWLQEVQCMEYAGVKADIESLYARQTIQEFSATIQKMIASRQWI